MSNTFSEQDEYWMSHALGLAALAADQQEVPVGAVMVRGNEIIGQGFNQSISACDPTAHAEIVALRAACEAEKNYRLPGVVLYVTLEPCSMCASALVHARISRLVYGASEPKAGAIESAQKFLAQGFLNHQIKAEGGCLAEPSQVLLQQFFAERRLRQKRLKL